MADRGRDHDAARNVGREGARDVGRTSGGGSLGHEQPREVEEQTDTRNNTGTRDEPPAPPAVQQ